MTTTVQQVFLLIFTEYSPFLKADLKPFDILSPQVFLIRCILIFLLTIDFITSLQYRYRKQIDRKKFRSDLQTNYRQRLLISKESSRNSTIFFTWTSSLNYDFQKKPKGFSTLTHSITTMPFNVAFGSTTLNFSNNFRGRAGFLHDESDKLLNFSATLSLKGNLDYMNYYPVKPTFNMKGISADDECCNGSQKRETKPWDITSSFTYKKIQKQVIYHLVLL